MATQQPLPTPSSAPKPGPRGHHFEELILVLLILLAGAGVAINDYSRSEAYTYWLLMAPTFGVISVAAAYSRARERGESTALAVQHQLLHWLGVVGAVYLVYTLQTTGRMENEAAGLAALIVIALAAFLAGVHSDWRLMVVGAVLGVAVVGFAILEEILVWLVLGAFALIAVGLIVVRYRYSKRAAA